LDTDLKIIHVDREREDALFQRMIRGEGQSHVLLIQAPSGMGKSFLLKKWWDECQGVLCGRVNLKSMSYSAIEILGELCQQLGPHLFDHFYTKCEEFCRMAGVHIERATLFNSPIDATLGTADSEQRQLRRQILTDAFFADLSHQDVGPSKTVLLLFDTFERASPDVKDWISGLFLTRTYRCRWLVVVIAGQEVPQLDVDWSDLCMRVSLTHLSKDNMREYVRRLQLNLEEAVIEAIYDITDGRPYDVALQLGRLWEKRKAVHG